MLMWLFTRLTALAMYALVLFALIGALVMGARNHMSFADVMRWGFMPNVTHVQSTDVPELEPWATPMWKVTACLMLLVRRHTEYTAGGDRRRLRRLAPRQTDRTHPEHPVPAEHERQSACS